MKTTHRWLTRPHAQALMGASYDVRYRTSLPCFSTDIAVRTVQASAPSSLGCVRVPHGMSCPALSSLASACVALHSTTRHASTSAAAPGFETPEETTQEHTRRIPKGETPSRRGKGNSIARLAKKKKTKKTRLPRQQKSSPTGSGRSPTEMSQTQSHAAAAAAAATDARHQRQLFSQVPRPPTVAELREVVFDGADVDDAVATHVSHTTTGHQRSEGDQTQGVEEMGWSYDSVDPRTGQTRLEKLYASHLSRVQAIMAQPLPPLPPDGSVNPDFFIGFAHYHYRLRDEYRALVARELGVPVQAVRLSVAWSGRFDVTHFNRVQKVCGVALDRDVLGLSTTTPGETAYKVSTTNDSQGGGEVPFASSSSATPLPADVAMRVQKLVSDINGRQSERWLSMHLVQASDPIPEVEFAMTHREEQWLSWLHSWIAHHVLQSSLAVFVVGGNALYQHAAAAAAASASSSTRSRSSDSQDSTRPFSSMLSTPPVASSAERAKSTVAAVVAKDVEECARQTRFVENQWTKLFHNRRVIPRVVHMAALAGRLAEAVAHDLTTTTTTNIASLPTSVKTYVRAVADAVEAARTSAPAGGDSEADGVYARAVETTLNARLLDTQTALTEEEIAWRDGALTWWRLCREALLFQHASSPTAGHNANHSAHDEATPHSDVFYRFSTDKVANRGELPAAFVHGALLGGMSELQYLRRNRNALDAVILHPNDITFKRKFAHRMKSGHSRLQMETEAKPFYTQS